MRENADTNVTPKIDITNIIKMSGKTPVIYKPCSHLKAASYEGKLSLIPLFIQLSSTNAFLNFLSTNKNINYHNLTDLTILTRQFSRFGVQATGLTYCKGGLQKCKVIFSCIIGS